VEFVWPLHHVWTSGTFDLRTGLPDASLFPYETWRRLHMEQLRAEVIGKGAYTVAADRDVAVQSLARLTLDQPLRPGIVLGYGAIAIDEIQAGLDILKATSSWLRRTLVTVG
jgi:hypothetical protein